MSGRPRYRVPEDVRRAAVFDPACVILGTKVIDWGAFGWGNTVIVDPVPLHVTTRSVQNAARDFATTIGCSVSLATLTDDQRADNKQRVAVVFTRKSMVAITQSQGEWLGAIRPG